MIIHQSFQDFFLFLYVHMGLADNYMHPADEEVILGKMHKIFPDEINYKEKFDAAVVHYKTLSHEEAMEIIQDTFKHFDQLKFAQKYKVYTDLYDVINADGKVVELEIIALEKLKKIININIELKQA